MVDREFSLGCATAAGLWLLGVALLVVSVVVGSLHVSQFGLAFTAAAATAQVRQYHVTTNRLMREAFQLGRDLARADPKVRPLR